MRVRRDKNGETTICFFEFFLASDIIRKIKHQSRRALSLEVEGLRASGPPGVSTESLAMPYAVLQKVQITPLYHVLLVTFF